MFEILRDGLFLFWFRKICLLELSEDEFSSLDSVLETSLNLEFMNEKQAGGFLRSLFLFLDEPERSFSMLKKSSKIVRPLVLR